MIEIMPCVTAGDTLFGIDAGRGYDCAEDNNGGHLDAPGFIPAGACEWNDTPFGEWGGQVIVRRDQ